MKKCDRCNGNGFYPQADIIGSMNTECDQCLGTGEIKTDSTAEPAGVWRLLLLQISTSITKKDKNGIWFYLDESESAKAEASQAALVKSQAEEIERLEALCDSNYAAGVGAGWNCGVENDFQKRDEIISSRSKLYLKALAITEAKNG